MSYLFLTQSNLLKEISSRTNGKETFLWSKLKIIMLVSASIPFKTRFIFQFVKLNRNQIRYHNKVCV